MVLANNTPFVPQGVPPVSKSFDLVDLKARRPLWAVGESSSKNISHAASPHSATLGGMRGRGEDFSSAILATNLIH